MRALWKCLLAPAVVGLMAVPVFSQCPTAIPQPFGGQPWFREPEIRRSINITDPQLTRLNDAYDRLQTRYREDLGRLERLNERERAERMRELYGTYRNDVYRSFGGVLDDRQMARYRQLDLQYRGMAAFSDAEVVKRLGLTEEQQRKFLDLSQAYDRTMRDLADATRTNPDQAMKRWDEFQRQNAERINSILTENQRALWTELTGDPYTFRPDFGGTRR